RGITIPNILKGIHLSMGGRYFRLLTSAKAEGASLVTGGLAMDEGLLAAMREIAVEQGSSIEIRSHEHSVLAGAIGAALWGGFRARKLRSAGLSLEAEEGA
ncbi:MAG: BadF/BadG/BcrA/BcrD ATPase family protein, partial [Planctomycetota bacterium]